MSNIDALLEAERRGILPESKLAALNEARSRGLIPALEQPRQANPEARAALQAELDQRLAAADEAGRTLNREEKINAVARPLLRGAADFADGVTALPRLVASAPVASINAVTGSKIPLPITQGVSSIADSLRGSNESSAALAPRNDSERLASTVTQGLGGVLGGAGIGGALARSASPVVSGVGNSLGANLGLQTASAVTGAASSEAARRNGAGSVGQTLAGLAGGIAPSLATAGATAAGRAVNAGGGLSRTPEAQRLLDAGVDLTPGLLKPKGALNQVEEATQSVGLVGSGISAGRENARTTFERAAIQAGAAPGTNIRQATPAQMLDEAYNSYVPLYDQAKGFPASAQIVNTSANTPLSTALRSAVRNGSIIATDEERKAVLKFLKSQLTKGVSSSDDLLNIRSAVRKAARDAAKGGNADRANLFSAADDQITLALESQLPAAPLQALKTADANYGNYKIVEAAVARSKDRPGGFTPNDLSEAVAQQSQGVGRGSYARGGGGPLRQLASDARTVLDSRSPPTGARLLALAPGVSVGAIDPVTGVLAQGATTAGVLAGAGTQLGRDLAAGRTGTQQALRQYLLSADIPKLLTQNATNTAVRQAPTATDEFIRQMLGIPEQDKRLYP